MNFLDLLYTPKCIHCGVVIKNAAALCDQCFLLWNKEKIKADNINYLSYYDKTKRNITRSIILNLKDHNYIHLYNFISDELVELINKNINIDENTVIVNVPRSKRNINKTGIDHVKKIAFKISKKLDIKYIYAIKNTGSEEQKLLNREERNINAEKTYVINKRNIAFISDKKIILLDDVITTGNTINQCKKILMDNGCSDVFIFSVSRSKINNY